MALNMIITPVIIKNPINGKYITIHALWDTGCTSSSIAKDIIDTLNLPYYGHGKSALSTGELTDTPKYRANIYFDSKYYFPIHVRSMNGLYKNVAQMLIGMDIISQGNLSINNYNGTTMMNFTCLFNFDSKGGYIFKNGENANQNTENTEEAY